MVGFPKKDNLCSLCSFQDFGSLQTFKFLPWAYVVTKPTNLNDKQVAHSHKSSCSNLFSCSQPCFNFQYSCSSFTVTPWNSTYRQPSSGKLGNINNHSRQVASDFGAIQALSFCSFWSFEGLGTYQVHS